MCVHFWYLQEIDLLIKDKDSTRIYIWRKSIQIDWLTCGQLILTRLLNFSYDVFSVLHLLPLSLKEISFGGCGLLDIFKIGYFYWYLTYCIKEASIPVHTYFIGIFISFVVFDYTNEYLVHKNDLELIVSWSIEWYTSSESWFFKSYIFFLVPYARTSLCLDCTHEL